MSSFTSCAKFLAINSTTVSRKIAKLEDDLGVQLIEKSNNAFSLTDAGLRLMNNLMDKSFNFDELKLVVNNSIYQDAAAPGELFISLPPGIGATLITRHIPQFILQHPQIRLNICYQNKDPELARDNIDIAIVPYILPKNLNQKFKKIAAFTIKLYCTQEYQAKYGVPTTPLELNQHLCAGLLTDNLSIPETINFTHIETAQVITIPMPQRITTNSTLNNIELILSNEAIAGIVEYTDHSQHYPNLLPILADYEIDKYPLYLLKHPYRKDHNITLFANFLENLFLAKNNR